MANLSEDNDLSAKRFQPGVRLPDNPLQLKHHRTGAVYHPAPQFPGPGIGGGRFAMGADQQGLARRHRIFRDRPQTFFFQTLQLRFVVNDGAHRIQRLARMGPQELLGLADGADHATAETGTGIYLNL